MILKPRKTLFVLIVTSILGSNTVAYAQSPIYDDPTQWVHANNVALETDQPNSRSDHIMDKELKPHQREQKKLPASRIEDFYSQRIVDELEQYGYNIFAHQHIENHKAIMPATTGGVSRDSLIIGVGDTLDIIIRGQVNDHQEYTISPQGLLILEQFPPISVVGLTLKQLQERLSLETESLVNTDIFVTLKTIRQVGVTVAGHVKAPGRHVLTATHTIMDALQRADGIEKTGSLRNIQLVRGETVHIIDLYGLLQNGTSRIDMPLREGDKIIVPAVGATLAIAGDVKEPAIYEIPTGSSYSLMTLLRMAGGTISPSDYRFIKLSVNSHGQEITKEVSRANPSKFGDGSVLIVSRQMHSRKGAVELKGHSNTAGLHDLRQSKTLADLLPDRSRFSNDIYPLIGLIERWNEKTLAPEYVSFSPLHVVNKQGNIPLQQNDKVHLFSREDIAALSHSDNQEENRHTLKTLSIAASPSALAEEHGYTPTSAKETLLKTILKEHAVYIRGAVRQAGAYPIYPNTAIDDILSIAGGYTLEADTTKIEVTENRDGSVYRQTINLETIDTQDIALQAGDTIRVNTKSKSLVENSVYLYGEITSPGRYDLMPGDTLLSLIERAGGLSEYSYPDGAIFSRKSERKMEETRYKNQATDLRLRLADMLNSEKKPNQEQVRTLEKIIRDLENARAIGRITVEADPETLVTQPELNILLENGDKVHVPKRPMTVRVAGEVLSPAALQFRSDKNPFEYISEAGGFSYYADKKRAFAILPNGSAQPFRANHWQHQASFIPPGSTIIVPKDPKPFDFIESAKDISQIIANLAVSAALTEDLGDD